MLKAYIKITIIVLLLSASVLYGVGAIFAMKNAADGKVYWCRDFKSQADAQRHFETGDERYYRLDGDRDGIACQSHPYINNDTLNKIKVK